AEISLNVVKNAPKLLMGGAVFKTDLPRNTPMGHGAEIRHRIVGEMLVRHVDGRTVEAAHQRGAEADLLHHAFNNTIHENPVAITKALFNKDGYAADEIFEQVLSAKRHGNTKKAKPCDD